MAAPTETPNTPPVASIDDTDIESQLEQLQLANVTSTGKVIGKGSYGQVIEVCVHGTLCAAKEILIQHDNAEQVRSFQVEFVKSCRIFHPNVVQVLGVYYPNPRATLPLLVMEMMETSVKGLIEKHKEEGILLHFKLSILVDIAQGLEFLHAKNIVHGYLHSSNVLLTKHLVAKIADLGMAKAIEQSETVTQTQTPGVLHFMPPDVLPNKPECGLPVDVFSLACITLHLITCKRPEPKDQVLEVEGSLIALNEVQRREEYLQCCSIPILKSLIEMCLQNKPEKRPKISEVCTKLKSLKTHIDKQVPFATASVFELYEEIRQGDQQKKHIEAALKNAEDALASEKVHVAELKATIAAKDQKLQESCNKYENLLAAERVRIAELETAIKSNKNENLLAAEKDKIPELETARKKTQLKKHKARCLVA